MLRRVPQIVLYCGVASACFFLGERIEPSLLGAASQRAAEAVGLDTGTPASLSALPLLNSGPLHNDAIQAGAEPPTPAVVELQPALAADSANGTDDKPTTISGKDPESDTEFVELKNQPEVQGEGRSQAEIDSTPARDVDMIGDEGLPADDKSALQADETQSNAKSNN